AAVATAPEDEIYVRAISEALGIADNLVAVEIRRFRDAGLLTDERARVPGRGRTLYRRVPSPFWSTALALVDDATSPSESLLYQLQRGESATFEVKRSVFASLESLAARAPAVDATLKAIVAFLNGSGGTILVGATEAANPSMDSGAGSPVGPW